MKRWPAESQQQIVGEPVFVGAPETNEEDDGKEKNFKICKILRKNSQNFKISGVLLVPVTDQRENFRDFLLVLDAKTMKIFGKSRG